MAGRGLVAVVILVVFYWISDLVVALWIGGLLAGGRLFTLPLDLLPEGASSVALEVAARTTIGMIDKLRPFFVAAAIVLMASVVLSVVLERQARHSLGWWVIWVIRSATSVAMVAVAFYSFGILDAQITRVEQQLASLRTATGAGSLPGSVGNTAPHSPGAVSQTQPPEAARYGRATAETVRTSFQALHATYAEWMWVEFALGAFIILAGAVKEAAWRHSWLTEREIEQRVRGLGDPERRDAGQPERDRDLDASTGGS